MSKKRGLSLDEKRRKIVELFYETKDFYQLKELERLAPKRGVVAQSVKDVVQSLVDDGLVDTDKIGTSVYFWAFPSKAGSVRLNQIEELESKIQSTNEKIEMNRAKIAKAKVGREETGERETALKRLNDAQTRKAELDAQIKNFRDFHPDLINKYKSDIKVANESINRWTDNVFSIKSWCRNKFFIEESTLNKQFSIPEDLDYI